MIEYNKKCFYRSDYQQCRIDFYKNENKFGSFTIVLDFYLEDIFELWCRKDELK